MKKDFDCVRFQDEAALKIYEEIKGLNPEEQIAYWRRMSEQTSQWRKKMIQEIGHEGQ